MIKQRQASLPGLGLKDLVAESIAFIQQHEPPEGYFVGFSGGKDSIVTLELCRMAGVKHAPFYSQTTIDPPELLKFLRAHYPQVRWLRPAKSFFACVPISAPPYAHSAGAVITSKSVRHGASRLMLACSAFGRKNRHAGRRGGVSIRERLQAGA